MQNRQNNGESRKVVFGLVFLFVGIVIAYAPLTRNFFYADDFTNLGVAHRQGLNFGSLWAPVGPHIKPVFRAYIALEYKVFGINPAGYYCFNILIHWLNAVLVFLIFRRLFSSLFGGFLAAMFFGLTAAHCGTIMSVTNSVQAMAVLFQLGSLGFFLTWLDRGGTGRFIGALVLYGTALFTLTCGFDLLLVFIALAWWRRETLKNWTWTIPFIGVVVAYFVARMMLMPEGSGEEKAGPGLIPAVWIAFKAITGGIYQGFVHSFAGGYLFQVLPDSIRGFYKFFLIGLCLFLGWNLDRRLFGDRKKLLLVGILIGWVFASYALPALGRAYRGQPPSVIPKQMRYRYNPAVPVAGLAALLILSLRPVSQPGRHRKSAAVLAVFLPLILFSNLQRIGSNIQIRRVKASGYRSTTEALNREIDRLCQTGKPVFILNQPFRMLTLEGRPDMKWSVRPSWLHLVFGSEECAGAINFIETEEAAGKGGSDLIYRVDNQPEGIRLIPSIAERN